MIVLSAAGDGLLGTLSHKAHGDCRLIVSDEVWRHSVAARLPEKKSNLLPSTPTTVMLCVGTVAFALVLLLISPMALDFAARFIPYAWEDKLGSYATAEFAGDKVCTGSPLAQKALNRLAQNLDAEHRVFDVSVANIPMVNAISLPGRRIMIFNGLLTNTKTPDQLAGVLAHEVGHHHYRHPMRIFLQSAGGDLLLSMAFGNADSVKQAAGAARELLLLKGSRDFETQADAYAVTALANNNLDPHSLMDFLQVMSKIEPMGDMMPEWMNSHPITVNRTDALKNEIAALKKKVTPGRPAFSTAEWDGIKNFCKSGKK
jgi:predicted Zn-dependent protease